MSQWALGHDNVHFSHLSDILQTKSSIGDEKSATFSATKLLEPHMLHMDAG